MKQHLVLDEEATAAWQKLKQKPQLARTNASGLIIMLVDSYLNPPTHYATAPTAKKEETPAKGKAVGKSESPAAEPETVWSNYPVPKGKRTPEEDAAFEQQLATMLGGSEKQE